MASFDALAEAFVRLRAKDDGQLGQDVQSIVGRVAGDAALLFAGKKLLDVGVAGLDELKQAEVQSAQTAAVLRSTGGVAGITKDHVDDLAASMLDLAGVDDEAAQAGLNVLLTFRDIRNEAGAGNDVFDRAAKVALDLSKAFGQDLHGSIIQVGKALEDPIAGLTALRRVGIQFTQAQQDQIKALVASGDELSAQKLILKELETQVGGSAAAYGQTLAGSIDRSREEMANAKAELVQGFAPALSLGAAAATGLAHVVEEMPVGLQAAVGGIVFLGGGVASLARPIGDLIQLVNSIRAARVASAAATSVETAAEVANTDAKVVNAAATETETIASGGLLATLGPLGLALGVAAAGLTLFALNSGDGEKSAQALSTAIRQLDTDLADLSAGSPKNLQSDLKSFLDQLVSTTDGGEKYRDILNQIGLTTTQFAEVLGKGSQASGAFIASLAFSGAASEGDLRALGDLVHQVEQHSQATLAADVATGRLTQSQVDQAAATHLNAAGTTDWTATLGSLQGQIAAATSATDTMTASQADQLSSARNLFDAQQAYTQAQDGVARAARGVTDAERGVEDANRRVDDSYRAVADAAQRLQDAQEALAKAQQGASAEDLGKGQLDISDANLRVADAQTAVNDAEKQLEKDRRLRRSPATIAADEAKLTKAQNDLQRAIYGVTDAQEAYDKLQQKGTDQDQAVIDAKKQVETATRNVEDANRNAADAIRSVHDAQQRVVDAKDAVNAALLTEADAGGKLADAQSRLHGATESVNTQLQNQLTAFQNIDTQLAPGSPARQHLDDYITNLFVLAGIFGTVDENTINDSGQLVHVGTRASGGDVPAGWSGLVGENDVEFLEMYPGGGGHVYTRQQAAGARSPIGGGDTYYEINIHNAIPERSSRSIERFFARQSVLNSG